MLNSFFDRFIFTNALKYSHSNFFLLNVGFAIVPVDVLAGLASISSDEANRALYSAVKLHVRDSLVQSFQLSPPIGRELLFLEEFWTASGWGLVQHVDLDEANKRAIVVVNDNPVARVLQGKAKKPVDHVFRGVLAGVFSHLFSSNVDCVEHSCLAVNGQRCEFVIKPQPEFDFSKNEPREQLVLTD